MVAGRAGQRAYLLGLAPGSVEASTGLPWQGRAGRTLRAGSAWTRTTFFATFYCAAVTRCYPGKASSGRGDRTASAAEQALCATWAADELRLLRPLLVVTVGLTPARR